MRRRTLRLQSGSILEVETDEEFPQPAPDAINKWLYQRGWHQHNGGWRTGSEYPVTWEQAMSIEFYKFITLGGR